MNKRKLGARYTYWYNVSYAAKGGTETTYIDSNNKIELPSVIKDMQKYIAKKNNFDAILITSYILISKTRR